jgi:prolyl oligopeptidase
MIRFDMHALQDTSSNLAWPCRDPVTETIHGVTVHDPFRWLEDQNSPLTRAWLEAQSRHTQRYLDAVPGRDQIQARVRELLAVDTISDPWKAGKRVFYLKRCAQDQQPLIAMREDGANEVTLVDPASVHATATVALRVLAVSAKGDLLAYGASYGGDPCCSVKIVNVSGEDEFADSLPMGWHQGLVLPASGAGFYYSHAASGRNGSFSNTVRWHEFGSNQRNDAEVFSVDKDRQLRVELYGSPDGRFLLCLVVRASDPQTYTLYGKDTYRATLPRKLLELQGSICVPHVSDSQMFVLTDSAAPNLRIASLKLDDLANPHWIDLVPERQYRIANFAVAEPFLCVLYFERGTNHIATYDCLGQQHESIPSPPHGTIELQPRPCASDTLFYSFSSFNQPPTIYAWCAPRKQQSVWWQTTVPFDFPSIEVEQVRYPAKDGTAIPIILASKKSRRRRLLPTFLTGYGGFGKVRAPQFHVYSSFLLESGFVFAVANVRGGGDFGAAWHLAAKREKRQTAIDDFLCAAEWLIHMDVTTPEKLAIGGASNGGLLVGAAVTQRPDLFRVAVCAGPMLDMLRYHLFDHAQNLVSEFGSATNASDFWHLLAYSPYHRIRDGVSYPSTFIISGDLDRTCNPMHARKMVARLQVATNSERPILLDYKPHWGHVAAQPLTGRIEALTDRLAFICHELGVATNGR